MEDLKLFAVLLLPTLFLAVVGAVALWIQRAWRRARAPHPNATSAATMKTQATSVKEEYAPRIEYPQLTPDGACARCRRRKGVLRSSYHTVEHWSLRRSWQRGKWRHTQTLDLYDRSTIRNYDIDFCWRCRHALVAGSFWILVAHIGLYGAAVLYIREADDPWGNVGVGWLLAALSLGIVCWGVSMVRDARRKRVKRLLRRHGISFWPERTTIDGVDRQVLLFEEKHWQQFMNDNYRKLVSDAGAEMSRISVPTPEY